MSIRILVSAVLTIVFLSTLCRASQPEPVCFWKDQRCCYEYKVAIKPVVKEIMKKYPCKYRKCDPRCHVDEGLCVKSEFRSFLKYIPKLHCYAHTLFSGNETKPRDIIGKVGTFIKTEGEGVDPTITPEPLPMF